MNSSEIVYIGKLAEALIVTDLGRVKFVNRVPRSVPDKLAKKLLRDPDFLSRADFEKTMEARIEPGPVLLRRWGALGDLIMLRAVAHAFYRTLPAFQFQLQCQERFAGIFAGDGFWGSVGEGQGDGVVPTFSMNQVAEQDHRGVEEHRADLFWNAMTTRKLDIRPEDWKIPIPDEARKYVAAWMEKNGLNDRDERPLIGLQIRGSGLMKSLPEAQVRALAANLVSKGNDVVLIENDHSRCFIGDHIYFMAGRDTCHALALIERCALVVCFDSGVLWMTHITGTPVLCIMGPTRPEQRLKYHPLADPDGDYSKGCARAVKLNELVVLNGKTGCPPCFEAAGACRGTYACIQKQPDGIVEKIAAAASNMLIDHALL